MGKRLYINSTLQQRNNHQNNFTAIKNENQIIITYGAVKVSIIKSDM